MICGLKHFWRAGGSWKALAQKAWEEAKKVLFEYCYYFITEKIKGYVTANKEKCKIKVTIKITSF